MFLEEKFKAQHLRSLRNWYKWLCFETELKMHIKFPESPMNVDQDCK